MLIRKIFAPGGRESYPLRDPCPAGGAQAAR